MYMFFSLQCMYCMYVCRAERSKFSATSAVMTMCYVSFRGAIDKVCKMLPPRKVLISAFCMYVQYVYVCI